jgi:hypothetical protein
VNISCICYLVSLRSGMVERLKGAIGSREDRKKVHIPEHRARHRHLSTESSTTSSACAKFIGFRPLRSTYIRSSISQVLVKAKLDHLHLTRYLCRVQPYTSAPLLLFSHSSMRKGHTLVLHHLSNFQHSINSSLVILDLIKE